MKILLFAFGMLLASSLHAQNGPAKDEFIHIMGKKIWYHVAGKGKPLILIPGGVGGSHDYYLPYFSVLEKSFKVIYYDGFGRGKSEKAKKPSEYTFVRDIDEVDALRKALNLGQVNVLGHSYAGYVAEAYAIKYPNSVDKLILSNTFINGEDWQKSDDLFNANVAAFFPEVWHKIDSLRKTGLLASSPKVQQQYFGIIDRQLQLFYFYNPLNAHKIVFTNSDFNAEEYYQISGQDADFNIGGDMRKLDFTAGLKNYKKPVLIIAGRSDGVVFPALVAHFRKVLPHATYHTFEKSGHFAFIEENAAYMALIKKFLD